MAILTLTVEEPAGRGNKVTRTYSSRVRLRNVGLWVDLKFSSGNTHHGKT